VCTNLSKEIPDFLVCVYNWDYLKFYYSWDFTASVYKLYFKLSVLKGISSCISGDLNWGLLQIVWDFELSNIELQKYYCAII
jgi:hypothetical protein